MVCQIQRIQGRGLNMYFCKASRLTWANCRLVILFQEQRCWNWYGHSCTFQSTDYQCPVRKSSSLHDRKSTPTSKFLGTVEAYFCPKFLDFFDLCIHWVSVVRGLNTVEGYTAGVVLYKFSYFIAIISIKLPFWLMCSVGREVFNFVY